MPSKPVAIVIAGDPVPAAERRRGHFGDMIRSALGDTSPWSIEDIWLFRGQELPEPERFAAVVVSGSPASVTDRADWTLRGEAWLRQAVSDAVPVFGVCYGHQMLAQALGGEVAKNPRGREIGSVDLELGPAADPLLGPLAEHAPLRVNMTHVDSVVKLPAGAEILASTERDPHAAVRFADKAWGVQFHPEIDGEIMVDYIETRRDALRAEGLSPEALVEQAEDTPHSAALFRSFLRLVIGP